MYAYVLETGRGFFEVVCTQRHQRSSTRSTPTMLSFVNRSGQYRNI
jgi:hypothetical protein